MSTRSPEPRPLWQFWQPRHWPVWAGVALLRLAVLLPYRVQLALGRGLGNLMRLALPGRRRVAAINLALCFPEAAPAERRRLLRRHFQSLGIAPFELGLAWWGGDEQLRRLVRVRGLEHATAPLARGEGLIILSGHFPAIELTGRVLQQQAGAGVAALYRPTRNLLVNELLRRGRLRAVSRLIPKHDLRLLLRSLREGFAVWYAPDQSFGQKSSALVPFMGEPAMTNTALTQLCRLSGARVVPFLTRRRPDGSGYDVDILPPLEGFPGPDPADDARRVNEILAAHIRGAPEQYYWVHRRFKGRPAPLPDPYR